MRSEADVEYSAFEESVKSYLERVNRVLAPPLTECFVVYQNCTFFFCLSILYRGVGGGDTDAKPCRCLSVVLVCHNLVFQGASENMELCKME